MSKSNGGTTGCDTTQLIQGIYFFSYEQFRSIRPNSRDVVVSVSDRFYEADVTDGYLDVLRLKFSDVVSHEEVCGAHEGVVPFSTRHALAIAELLNRVITTGGVRYLLIHCYAGISRSAAIAWWASRYYKLPLLTNFPPHGLNKLVLATLPGKIGIPNTPTATDIETLRLGRTVAEIPQSWLVHPSLPQGQETVVDG